MTAAAAAAAEAAAGDLVTPVTRYISAAGLLAACASTFMVSCQPEPDTSKAGAHTATGPALVRTWVGV
jgi:hypothetical protein